MPECQYCDASFDSEEAYLEHLEAAHPDDLGPIDRKRLGVDPISDDGDESGISLGILVLGFVIVVAVIIAGGVVLLTSGGNSGSTVDAAQQPTNVGSAHYHGTMEVIITGERVDFSQDRYQLQADAFHFEGGDGTRWHVHAEGVTLEFALATLGIDVTESSVTYAGTTYRDSSAEYSVRITVNGESVTPSEYVLQPEDRVRIVVEAA
ncbi:MAG: hypothetical protein ABEJ48_08770 [Halobacteriales archaeon]